MFFSQAARLCLALLVSPAALASTYDLTIAAGTVQADGRDVPVMTINGQVPGPTLHWREGETVTIRVTNRLEEPTSLHWHGLLLPGAMDGVPGLNGYQATRTLTRDETTKQIPIIVCTSKGQETDRIWGLRQGALDYLVKPVKAVELLAKIAEI